MANGKLRVPGDLLGCCEIERERDACLLLALRAGLELFPDQEVAVVVEDEQVAEVVHEQVVIRELLAPGLVEVDQR